MRGNRCVTHTQDETVRTGCLVDPMPCAIARGDGRVLMLSSRKGQRTVFPAEICVQQTGNVAVHCNAAVMIEYRRTVLTRFRMTNTGV